MPRKKKNVYNAYSQDAINKALEEYTSSSLTLRKAAEKYGVPRSTLSDRALGRHIGKAGKPAVIPAELEKGLVNDALLASERGLGLSKHQLMVRAAQVCKRYKITTPFKNGVPGREWFRGLKNRHPEIGLRKPAKLSSSRSKLDAPSVDGYFSKLGELYGKHNITDPCTVWNMDEKGVSLEHKPSSVIARKGTRQVHGKVSTNRENITIVAAVNAAGGRIPPLIIVKGKTSRSLLAYGTDEGPDGAAYTFQSNAWMEDVLGVLWFENVFLPNCGEQRPQVLIMDQHKSHEPVGLLKKAKDNNIIILTLPSHSSHVLQPLDKGVFGPLERQYNTVCTEYTSESGHVVTKCVWPKLFKCAWEKSLVRENILSGFRTTGIWPFCREAIPVTAFAPSSDQSVNVLSVNTSCSLPSATATSTIPSPSATSTIQSPSATSTILSPSATSTVLSPSATSTIPSPSATSTIPSPSATSMIPCQSATSTIPCQSATTSHDNLSAMASTSLVDDSPFSGSGVLPLEPSLSLETPFDDNPLLTLADASLLGDLISSESPSKGISVIDLPLFPELPEGACVNVNVSNGTASLSGSQKYNSETCRNIKVKQTVTQSRILTSDEVIREKERKEELKMKKKQQTEERKRKREAKQQAEILQKLILKLAQTE